MSIIFLKGNQHEWFPENKNQTIRIPLQKKITESGKKEIVKEGDEIVIDKVLEKDKVFGQPFLPIKLIGKVIRNWRGEKGHGMKYQAKKRIKKFWGYRQPYTEIKIVAIENLKINSQQKLEPDLKQMNSK